ncbi:MAG TPA: outer membrane protein assembly factor BamD [Luteibaculaceae bacterium]|nr:outer membrane protein assembly factor BamD [Luteibaculaceae bacterium]
MFLRNLFVFFLAALLSACSGYNRLLKSPDAELRFNKAVEYYKEGKYGLSLPLLEDLIPAYRGTAKAELVYYYFAMSHYQLEDYPTAAAYLKNFVKTFPKSEYSEDCAFLSAMCTYNTSPKYSLDQTDTRLAITDFQLFLNRYPDSKKRDTINQMMIRLQEKLERKSFEIAKLYHQTERYNAAVLTLENCLRDFPNTKYEENILFMLVESHYKMAKNSVESKQKERLEQTVKAYQRYIDKYSKSDRSAVVEDIFKSTQSLLQTVKQPS